MKKSMKWFLGILISLIVVAVLVTAVFLITHRWDRSERLTEAYNYPSWYNGRGMPDDHHAMSMVRHNNRLFPIGMFFGSLLGLGFLGLVVLGMITLVRSLIRPSQPLVAPGVAPQPTPVPSPEVTPTPGRNCSNCGHQVQDEWSHCPYCGTALTGAV